MLTKEAIQNMNEADLRTRVLIPLLKAMGYQDVFEYHGGVGEQGKDIVCWKTNDLGIRQNFALVVKAQPVNGRAQVAKGTAGEVLMQITQCFGDPYREQKTGREQEINLCWVVSNHEITKEAIESITSAISATKLDRLTTYIDGDTLWRLVQQYLPVQAVWQTLGDAGKILESIDDSHYSLQAKVSGRTVEIGIGEKYPGALQDKPFEIHAAFAFPDTPEGRTKKEELEKAFATGSPVDIPAEFVRSIELPDFVRPLLGSSDLESPSLSLSPITSGPRVIMDIHFECGDDVLALENVPFRTTQAGQKEITLESDEYPAPVKIKLTLRPGEKNASVNFRFTDPPLNVRQVLEILKLRKCMSVPFCIRCTHAATQLPMFVMPQPNGIFEEPEAEFMEAIGDLVQIQLKVKRPLTVPSRDFTDGEMQIIGRLRAILHTGRLKAQWTGFSITAVPEAAKDVLEVFGNGKAGTVIVQREETEELFGMSLPLGAVRLTCTQAKLANEAEVRELYAKATDDTPEIRVKFVPGDDPEVIKEYLNWLPNSAS